MIEFVFESKEYTHKDNNRKQRKCYLATRNLEDKEQRGRDLSSWWRTSLCYVWEYIIVSYPFSNLLTSVQCPMFPSVCVSNWSLWMGGGMKLKVCFILSKERLGWNYHCSWGKGVQRCNEWRGSRSTGILRTWRGGEGVAEELIYACIKLPFDCSWFVVYRRRRGWSSGRREKARHHNFDFLINFNCMKLWFIF